MDRKQVGRPKLYDSSSEKLEAFRKRLESAGFMRKELLVTKETWEQVVELAEQNGVSASDAASGLLEFGVRSFKAKAARQPVSEVMFSRKEQADAVAVVQKPKPRGGSNPIADFFVKRKEVAQTNKGNE